MLKQFRYHDLFCQNGHYCENVYLTGGGGGGGAGFNYILWKSPTRVFSSGSPSPFGAGDPGEKTHGYHRVNYVDNGNQTFSKQLLMKCGDRLMIAYLIHTLRKHKTKCTRTCDLG